MALKALCFNFVSKCGDVCKYESGICEMHLCWWSIFGRSLLLSKEM
jgi:hypothetical protein